MSYHTRGEHTNHYTTDAGFFLYIKIIPKISFESINKNILQGYVNDIIILLEQLEIVHIFEKHTVLL